MATWHARAYAGRVFMQHRPRNVHTVIIEEGTPVVSPAAAARPRWAVAVVAGVAALAIAMGAVAGTFLVGRHTAGAGAGPAASYVPADAVMYFEVRLDLPGDQRAMLRQVLDRFESIDTETLLGAGLASWLDDQLAKSHGLDVSYSNDIAPWFNGEVAMALHDYPSAVDRLQMQFPEAVASLGVGDVTAARNFTDRMRDAAQQKGASFSAEQHQGVEVWSLTVARRSDENAFPKPPGMAYAVTDDQILFGTGSDAVERALDVHSGTSRSLDQREELRRLAGQLPADRVGFVAVDSGQMYDQLRKDAAGISPELGQLLDEMRQSVPQFGVGAARFENDRLTFQMLADAPSGSFAIENAQRDLARWAPDDAIFFGDAGNLGASLTQFVRGLKVGAASAGASQEQLDQVESALGGDLESFVSWVDDGAMVAGWDGEQPYGGAILVPNDAAVARQKLGQLVALARLGADQAGGPISITEDSVDGVPVTTIRYQPDQPLGVGASDFALQYAVTDERVLIGFGDRFVGRVLTLAESESLAASERYRIAMGGVGGTNNAASSFLDLAALRGAVETAIPTEMKADYDRMVLPFVEPFDFLVSATRLDGSVAETKAAVVLR